MKRLPRSGGRRAAIVAIGALAALVPPAAALAAQPDPIVFHYTDCVGPSGTPETFDAYKLPRTAAGLHVIGSTAMWLLVHVESVETGEVFVDMPSQYHEYASVPTTTCLIFSPLRDEFLWATGVFLPPLR